MPTVTIPEDEALSITLAYLDEIEAIAAQIGFEIRGVFLDLTHTNRADIEEFIREASPLARAGIAEGDDLAAAYISEMTGTNLTAREVVAPTIPWESPFHRTWHQQSERMPYLEAKESGASVAEMIGHDATRDGATARMGTAGKAIRGWRRVISAKACEWCRLVATQLYRSESTATFGHHGCKCQPMPIFFGNDPSFEINQARQRERLQELKAEGAMARVNAARERSRSR